MNKLENLWLKLPRPVQYALAVIAVLAVITAVYRFAAGLPLLG